MESHFNTYKNITKKKVTMTEKAKKRQKKLDLLKN